MQTQETLTYVRVARKAKDGNDGFLYLHKWATGYQELIFPTAQAADDFRTKLNNKKQEYDQKGGYSIASTL